MENNLSVATKMRKMSLYWMILSGSVVVMDQVTKYIVTHTMTYGTSIPLLSFLSFTLERNRGAAFSFLSHWGHYATALFIVTALIISLILLLWLVRLPAEDRWLSVSLALLLGGALGNLI